METSTSLEETQIVASLRQSRRASLRDHFSIVGATSTTAGIPVTFTVTTLTNSNVTDTSYNGTIHFSSSDSQAVLPADTALVDGVGTFTVTFGTAGCQMLTATDTAISSITGTTGITGGDPITVSPAAATHLRRKRMEQPDQERPVQLHCDGNGPVQQH